MWEYLLLSVTVLLLSLCCSAKYVMRVSWENKKEELIELNKQLEQMEELTDELKEQKKEIEELLQNEFRDYDALFKCK